MIFGCVTCGFIGPAPGKCPDCGDGLVGMFEESQLYYQGWGHMKEYCEANGIERDWDRIAKLVGFDENGDELGEVGDS